MSIDIGIRINGSYKLQFREINQRIKSCQNVDSFIVIIEQILMRDIKKATIGS
ncbi:hypothetical protein ECTPHS_13863 [Ectothiorhodospira sp. PHS-1]|nr:hypothetical protein ECTPHS_13863 [Ectothiorhodospira sp. PHS-1]